MNKKILIVAGVLVIICLSFISGVFFQSQRDFSKVASADSLKSTFTSKIVSSSTAYGKITQINGRDITITATSGETMKFHLKSGAPIAYFVPSNPKAKISPTQTTSDLAKLKVGESVMVTLQIQPDAQIIATYILILTH